MARDGVAAQPIKAAVADGATTGSVDVLDVSKSFNGFPALKSVTLRVTPGETLSLLGPSGCGKTTLLRAICGLLDIDAGEIKLNGQLVSRAGYTKPVERRGVGMVFQNYALWPHMTVFENVAYGLKLKRIPRDRLRDLTLEAIEAVGLGGLDRRLPSELSGGQQQRVALARSLVARPTVLLLDEPLSNLDAALRDTMRKDLRRIISENRITAIYVTHDQREALYLSDRVALMHGGKVVQLSTPRELYESPHTAFAASFVGSANVLSLKEVTAHQQPGLAVGHVSGVGQVVGRVTAGDGTRLDRVGAAAWHPEESEVVPVNEPPTASTNSFPGTVSTISFEGRATEVAVDLPGGETIRAEVRRTSFREGDSVVVRVRHEHTLFVETDQ